MRGKERFPRPLHHHHHHPSSGSKGIAEELVFEVGNNHLLREHVGLPDRRMVGAPARTCGNTCTATTGKQTVRKHADKAARAHTHTLQHFEQQPTSFYISADVGVKANIPGGRNTGWEVVVVVVGEWERIFFFFLKPGGMNFDESVFGSKSYPGVIRRS